MSELGKSVLKKSDQKIFTKKENQCQNRKNCKNHGEIAACEQKPQARNRTFVQ